MADCTRVRDLLAALHGVDPMPSEEASDAEWDAWTSYQEFESTAVGLSRAPSPEAGPHLRRLRALLEADVPLRALLGGRLPIAHALLTALEEHHAQ